MLLLQKRKDILVRLGERLLFFSTATGGDVEQDIFNSGLRRIIDRAAEKNHWFTREHVRFSIAAWGEALKPHKVAVWAGKYDIPETGGDPGSVLGLVPAGNIPMVGLHDVLCAILTGTRTRVKLSSGDDVLLPWLVNWMEDEEPELKGLVTFTGGKLGRFDRVIATGSNNTARYFEYYFAKYPHIIRKNRNGVALFTGEEDLSDLRGIADDMLLYFGLGCRNVSKIYVPENYDFRKLLDITSKYPGLDTHSKYRNNYDYQKAIFLINNIDHYDNGNVLITRGQALSSPVSVVHYSEYSDFEKLVGEIGLLSDQIQCVVSIDGSVKGGIRPGHSQLPELWDYPDNIDVVSFLTSGD